MHKPVLLQEALDYLKPLPGQTIVDGTFGFGGHGKEIAKKIGAQGKLIGIEQDARTLKMISEMSENWPQIQLQQGNFADVPLILHSNNIDKVDGILLDLGVSSYQIKSKEHGLSWQTESLLDMRLSPDAELSALDLLHGLSEDDLANVLYENADEYRSRRIARGIKANLIDINTTRDLALVVEKSIGGRGKIHPATKTFQALRMEVNQELGNLTKILSKLTTILKPNGRAVIISFHSGEDRLVKNEFKNKETWSVLTKKPITASPLEIKDNPRSRSAKLRAAIMK